MAKKKQSSEVALDRDALYYPYIEIKSVNWLKATLLCFPQVRCIVPGTWSNDQYSRFKEFLEIKGARDAPLLVKESPRANSSRHRQCELRVKIEENIGSFKRRFSKAAAKRDYPRNWNCFRINHLKLEGSLADFLRDNKLAWLSSKNSHYWSLHPRLCRAVIATIAIAIANNETLDIVSSDESVHYSVLTQRHDDVFDELIRKRRSTPPSPTPEMTDELASVFMTTFFDMSKLSVQDIADLQKDGNDLRRFKNEIVSIAASIPDMPNTKNRQKRLKDAADLVHKEWASYRKSLPEFILKALFDTTEVQMPAGASAALGGAAYVPWGIKAGIAIGFTSFAGYQIWRKYQDDKSSPYQYLNKIHRKGATLTVPTPSSTK